jgi:hypothetical protein
MTQTKTRWESYFQGKDFSSDLTSKHFAIWDRLLQGRRNDPVRILEVGSWEGRSAIFFAEYFPNGTVTCIDSFAGGPIEHYGAMFAEIPNAERRFDENTKAYGNRITKIKSNSISGLDRVRSEGCTFDLIFIDGDHRRDNVLAESLLCWPMLRNDGVLIWDDYKAGRGMPMAERVRQATDVFLLLHAGEFDELERGAQVIIRKRRKPAQVRRRQAAFLWRNLRNMLR